MKAALLIILSGSLLFAERSPASDYNHVNDYNISASEVSVKTAESSSSTASEHSLYFNYVLSQVGLWGFITSTKDAYPVQLGAFRLKSNAEEFFDKVKELIENDAEIIFEDDYYKVKISANTGITLKYNTISIASALPDSTAFSDTLTREQLNQDTLSEAAFPVAPAKVPEEKAKRGSKILFIDGESPWLRRINYFGKSFRFVNALIVTIIFSITSMIILLVVILLNRRRMEKEEKLRQYLMEKYQTLIIDYLFGSATPDDFRPIASDTYRRQVLIDQIIDVSINLKGDQADKLLSLYKHLGLDRDSIKRAFNYRWHKKIKGFRELAFMNIKDANPAIYKALNSTNEILRMEAQIALVRLSDDDPFGFLSHLERPFSLWEQITLHELLIQHEIHVPSFKKWLSSPNDTVVMFALRMIREFKQTNAEPEVREVLQHQTPVVRHLAVQVAGDLGMTSTLETMKRMYKSQEYNICLEIVKSMGKMPDINMMGFLKLVLDKEDDVQLQIEATKAIENMGEEGVKALVKIMKSEYKNYNIIVRHVLDRRIY